VRRLGLIFLIVLAPLALWAALPLGSAGAPTAAQLQKQINHTQRQIDVKRGKEGVLSRTISHYSSRISRLQSTITHLQRRQNVIQTDLDAKMARLFRIQDDLRKERATLARLRARLARSRAVLSKRLIELYKADKPDVITVILQSDGFADLLEREEFLSRINAQDKQIIRRVRHDKIATEKSAKRLDRLERRQQQITAVVYNRRNEVRSTKNAVARRRDEFASARAQRRSVLMRTRASRQELEGDLRELQAAQARVTGILQGTSSPVAGPIRQGSGNFIWPVNGPVVSGFGMRWGRLHAGIDIAVPTGTPIRAAAAGRVVLMGWVNGYGNYTCVQHGGPLATCYAHQSRFGTSQGASVSQGQVIGFVGCTGHCFGPHLHFEVRINGSPVDPLGYL
jgi:murein DD-endopeptidase MepM/ murein hydrolase activator NlpD